MKKTIISTLFVLGLFANTLSQSNYQISQGETTTNLAPGSPVGAYPISGFETINPFSGKLNFSFPLFRIGGRGSAGYPINLNIQRNWHITHEVNDPNIYSQPGAERYVISHLYIPRDADDSVSSYGADMTPGFIGLMKGVRMGTNYDIRVCGSGEQPCYEETLTQLSFVQPDGTEISFRDVLLGGAPYKFLDNTLEKSRGTVWLSTDGTGATFTSSANIYDVRIKASVGNGVFFPSGTLRLSNGMAYVIENGQVTKIRDANGNEVNRLIDSLGREIAKTQTSNPSAGISREVKFDLKNVGGTPRFIRTNYSFLEDRLSDGYELGDLLGTLSDTPQAGRSPICRAVQSGSRFLSRYA